MTELDEIMKRLFEQFAKGSITDSRFRKLSAEYEKEQLELEQRAESMKTTVDSFREEQRNSEEWVELIKQRTDIKELDRIVLSELIEKITIGEAYDINGEKTIDVKIYYRLVGVVG